jgi:hypothetical protein
VDEAVKKRPFTERFSFFFSNLIGTKVIHHCESGQSSGLYFSGANEGTSTGSAGQKNPGVPFANFFNNPGFANQQ